MVDVIVNEKNPVTSVLEFVRLLPIAELRFGESNRPEEVPLTAVYRGQSDVEYELVSSLHRRCLKIDGNVEPARCYLYETAVMDVVEKHYPDEVRRCRTYLEKLSWMQHFGFPTRLLDVTTNALVALYFATGGCDDKDGKVYVIGTMRWERDQSLKRFHRNLCNLRPSYFCQPKLNSKHGGIRNNRKSYGPRLITPTFLSERQRRQSGAFYLMSNAVEEVDIRVAHMPFNNDSVEDSGRLVQEIIIDGRSKSAIREELAKRYGITRHFLFPEDPSDFVDEVQRFAESQLRLPLLPTPWGNGAKG